MTNGQESCHNDGGERHRVILKHFYVCFETPDTNITCSKGVGGPLLSPCKPWLCRLRDWVTFWASLTRIEGNEDTDRGLCIVREPVFPEHILRLSIERLESRGRKIQHCLGNKACRSQAGHMSQVGTSCGLGCSWVGQPHLRHHVGKIPVFPESLTWP